MPERNLQDLADRLTEYSQGRLSQNLFAQAHARSILCGLEVPEEQWPRFSEDLDYRVHYGASLLMLGGLDLLEGGGLETQARDLLKQGAEAMEFLCAKHGRLRVSKHQELLKAALAYSISGYDARSYVLVREARRSGGTPGNLALLIAALLEKNFVLMNEALIQFFSAPEYAEVEVASAVARGELAPEEAVNRLGQRSVAAAVSLYAEYLKMGARELLASSQQILSQVVELAQTARVVDLWWWSRAVRHLLRGLHDSSLWTGLSGFSPQGIGEPLLRSYVRGCLSRPSPITTLWPSQRSALRWLTDPESPSFGVRMPTSAGKTRIAELAILKTFLDCIDEPSAKCVYIAPFRSLAVEIERTLRSGLRSVGLRVSEIYGGLDVSNAEHRLIEQTQVLVATPEKFDAVLRQSPELMRTVRLVVVDEGHMAGEINERGLRAEFLITRLLRALPRQTCRYIFISAVLPNPEEFATWIAGDPSHTVQSDWRPSRQMIGECVWNGRTLSIEYTHEGPARFSQECFVRRFLEQRQVRGLPDVGRRRNPFPHSSSEAFALAACRFARQGVTLAFVPQARHVVGTGKAILRALRYENSIEAARGGFRLPRHGSDGEQWRSCVSAIREELGPESILLEFLEAGFAVHYAGLPTRVRLRIEDLVRAGGVNLIIATTTLANGINLPIRTVLVRGLQQGPSRSVDALTFWNICGRAGRAMQENEGQVLFFVDETKPRYSVRRLRSQVVRLVAREQMQAVLGTLHQFVRYVRDVWKRSASSLDFAQLCMKLAEDDFDWVAGEQRPLLQYVLSLIDEHLLAMATEDEHGIDTADRLQEVLRESLLFAQLGAHAIPDISEHLAAELLFSRLRSVYRRYPQPARRNRFYKLGFPLADCERVEEREDELRVLFEEASDWYSWSAADRIDLLCRIAQEALELQAIRSIRKELPDEFVQILASWLNGRRPVDIVSEGTATFTDDPGDLSRLLESVCVYGLAWAVNSILVYLTDSEAARSAPLPEVCSWFSGMLKHGLLDPVAVLFAPYLDLSRSLATAAARCCPHDIDRLDRALAWLETSSEAELQTAGLSATEARRIVQLQRPRESGRRPRPGEPSLRITVRVREPRDAAPEAGERLLLVPRPERSARAYDLFTATGVKIGAYRRPRSLPAWWDQPHLLDASVSEAQIEDDGSLSLRFEVRRVGPF